MNFGWDPGKAKRNRAKHGVSFEEATTVFDDPLYIDFFDSEHSDQESRFIRIGTSRSQRVLLVSYSERDSRTRIISARQATKRERQQYEEH